jgi:hypothetical protein
MKRALTTWILVFGVAGSSAAQDSGVESRRGSPLLPHGNSLPALRNVVSQGFDSVTVKTALTMVAVRARLNITYDPRLPGLETIISVPIHDRTAAEALLEITRPAGLRISVLADGQLVVMRSDPSRAVAPTTPDTMADRTRPVALPAMHALATRMECVAFDSAPNVGTISMGGRELSAASRFFAEADVLRGVQLMPGVEARNDYSAGMNVRGGEADQNLILLDGYPLYNPFHLGGLFGTFIDPMVGRVNLYTSGGPPQFGGRLSSVLDVRSAEEPRSGLHGNAEVSLISTIVSLGSAIDSGKGSWKIAGRRTYADKMIALLGKGTLPYHFQDAQAHFTHSLPGGARLSLTGYLGHDALQETASNGFDYGVTWGNRLLGVTVSKPLSRGISLLGMRIGDSARVEQRFSVSRFGINFNLQSDYIGIEDRDTDLRAEGSVVAFSPKHTRRVGYEIASQQLDYSTNVVVPLFPAASLTQHNLSGSLYYDDVWRPTHSLIIEAGARFDALAEPRWSALLPRVSVKYFLNDNLAITGAVGDYAQWVRSLAREDIPLRVVDIWTGSDSLYPPSRARHFVLGLERWVTPERSFRIEAFYKKYRNLLEPNPLDDVTHDGDEFLALGGQSYGADVMLRQFDAGAFSGWASYTYAVSTRTQPNGYQFFSSLDRRHDLNLVGNWRSERYSLGMRLNVASGTPYTNVLDAFQRREYDPTSKLYPTRLGQLQFVTGPRNAERLPYTHRFDLSLTRHAHLGSVAFKPYVSVANIANARNVFGYYFDYTTSPPERVGLPQFPILPTVGASLAW